MVSLHLFFNQPSLIDTFIIWYSSKKIYIDKVPKIMLIKEKGKQKWKSAVLSLYFFDLSVSFENILIL